MNARFQLFPKKTVLLFLAVSFFSQTLGAQTVSSSDSIKYTFPWVDVVSGVVKSTETVISRAQIESFKQEKISGDFLFLPGILRAPEPAAGEEIIIRGISQKRINIFYNGIPIRSNTVNTLQLDGLLFTDPDNIIVDKGAPSLYYGANSSGNVLRINSTPLSGKEFGIKASSYLGNNGKQSYNVKVSGHSDVFHYSASSGYFTRNSFRLSKKFEYVPSQKTLDRVNSDQKNLELTGMMTAVISKDHMYSLFGSFNSSEYGRPPSTVSPNYRRMDTWKNGLVGIRGFSLFGSDWRTESVFYYTTFKDTVIRYRNSSMIERSSFSCWYDQTFGGKAQLAKTLDDETKVLFSLDMKRDLHDQDWHTKASTKSTTTIAAFEVQNRSIEHLELIFGISHNWLAPNYVSEQAEVRRQSYSAFNYQLLSTYRPDASQFAFHLGASHTTIFPTTTDVFGDAMRSDVGYYVLPNPDLKEEQNTNIDAGVKWTSSDDVFAVDVSFYYNKISDMIRAIMPTDTTEKSINLDAARNIGIDLSAQVRIGTTFTTYLSYSYLNARNTSSNRTSDYLAYLPDHQLKLFSSYKPLEFLGADATVTYVSSRYFDVSGTWKSLSPYWLVDFSLNANLIRGVDVYAKLSNLLDENYQIANGFPQPGREYLMGIRVTH